MQTRLCKPRLKQFAIPRIFPGLSDYLSTPKTATRSSPGKRRRRADDVHNQKQNEWLENDQIGSYDGIVSTLTLKLRQVYPEIHVQHRETHSVLFKFKDNDDIDCNPTVCFCLRIFKDMHIRLWIEGVEVKSSEYKWLFSHTKHCLALWSQLFELIKRYS